MPWADVVVFHMDEYVGIGPDHPASFQRWIRERIVRARRVPVPPTTSTGWPRPTPSASATPGCWAAIPSICAASGSARTGTWPSTTHRWPTSTDALDVKVVALDPACRRQQVDEGHFASDADVPDLAVTVTIPALLRARSVLAVVPEARKAEPVRAALEGPVSTSCPASILQRTPHATIYLDADSAGSWLPAPSPPADPSG